MNQKQTTKYELIAKIATEPTIADIMRLTEIDFNTAFEMWEFALARGAKLAAEGLKFFLQASESKTRTLLCESTPLQKLIYQSPCAQTPTCLDLLANLILQNKLDCADECLQRLRTNTHLDFNEIMRTIVDTTFRLYCQKNAVVVPQFNKKQKTLLLDYINKIKGPNRALLLQRMKEL